MRLSPQQETVFLEYARREYSTLLLVSCSQYLFQWESDFVYKSPPPVYVFPEPDLLASLVKTYFEQVHPLYPAVHRTTFERGVRNNKHISDPQFGMVVLGVCALASRYSDDPRVFLDKSHAQGDEGSSAGWKYIIQVPFWRPSLYDRTSMHDLQYLAVSSSGRYSFCSQVTSNS